MKYFEMNALALLIGFFMDIMIGDPEGWPHPVIWIGKFISRFERLLRARCSNLRRAAPLLTSATILIAMLATAIVMYILSIIGKIPLLIGMSVCSWFCLSARCLAKEASGVERALRKSLEDGRTRVGRIVGRDTSELSRDDVIRATVETVAENTTDGVIAPMLYLFLGGPVLGLGFKAASTLDSMVGYLDEKYRDIGWSSAKLDDILNYVPARICGLLMCIVSPLCGLDFKNAFRIMRRDHKNHLSPNCAWSEAAAAGALHIRLGGPHGYFGKVIDKPYIGDYDRDIEPSDIDKTNKLMFAASALFLAVLIIVGLIVI